MPNNSTPSIDQHLDRITAALKGQQRNVGYTDTFEAFLGKGDGSSSIIVSTPGVFPIRQVWYHYYDGNIKVQGMAPLAAGSDLYYEDNASYLNLPIKVGYPPKQLGGDKLTVFQVSGASGQGMVGQQSPLEQKINKASKTGLAIATTDGVTSGSGILQLLVPPGSLVISDTTATLSFPTGSSSGGGTTTGGGGGGGGGGTVTTPTYLPPLLVNTLLQYTKTASQTLTAATNNIVNFDSPLLSQNVVGTPVTTGASWAFTAPVAGDYYIAFQVYYTFASGISMSYGVQTTSGYVLTSQIIPTTTSGVLLQLETVHLPAGGTASVYMNPGTSGFSANIYSTIEIGWNTTIAGGGSPTVVKTTVTSSTTSFATTQILSLPPNATIYDVRIVPPTTPGTLQATIGTATGTTTDVTLSTDSDLSKGLIALIPCYWVNSGTSNQVVNAYFSGTAGATNQNVTFIVSYI
jgi:hypothetical protein